MTVAIVLDHRYTRTPDGAVWSAGPFGRTFFERYLRAFDQVRVVARVAETLEPPPSAVRADGPGVVIHPLPHYVGPWRYLRRRAELSARLAEAIADAPAVILRLPSQAAFLLRSRLLRENRPFAVEVAGDPWQALSPRACAHPSAPLARCAHTRAMRRLCAEASAAAYVTRDFLQRRYPPRPSAYCACYSSVELPDAAFAGEPRQPSRAPELRLISVGSMDQRYKGQDVLLEAVRLCLDRKLRLRLTLVGDGRWRPWLERRAGQLGLSDAVEFLGALPAGRPVRDALDRADLFVLASRQEGLPRALLEAMARGLPALATKVGGVPEVLGARFLVDPDRPAQLAARILELARRSDLRAQASARNRAVAEDYSEAAQRPSRDAFYRHVRELTAKAVSADRRFPLTGRPVSA